QKAVDRAVTTADRAEMSVERAVAGVEFPELGCYGLAGHSASPRDLVDEVQQAEKLGLGSVFLSERFNVKDAAVLAGAAGAVSRHIGIATAATNHNTRHPLVTATMATSMHRLTGGRYALGLGRGFNLLFDVMGVPRVTSAQMEDAAGIYRTLWKGEAVVGHDGPAGKYPFLMQDASFDEDIPLMLMAIGDQTLKLAGRIADGVVLHTFFSDETLERSVAIIRESAAESGRDPAAIRIWSVLATVEESIPEELRLRKLVGRLATYLQGYGEVLVRSNGWDLADLERFRNDPFVQGFSGAFDAVGTVDDLTRISALLPDHWLAASATGDAAQCANRIADQFNAGADSVILHGATPTELAPVLDAWRSIRPGDRFDRLPANPGRAFP
ncbi:luciferase, partial [Williamsia sp. D3]